MDDPVSDLLERHVPAVSDSAGIRSEIGALGRATRGTVRRPRRLLTIGIPVLSFALVLGGVTTAVANPNFAGWWVNRTTVDEPWRPGCVQNYGLGSDPDNRPDPVSLAEARAIVRN